MLAGLLAYAVPVYLPIRQLTDSGRSTSHLRGHLQLRG